METPSQKLVFKGSGVTSENLPVSLSVIIVSYNVSGYLDHCLDAVIKACEGLSHEILVVDNGSTDTTLDLVRGKYPEVTLIENANNAGYSRANNQGLSLARGEYILFLNPDTIVPYNAFKLSINFLKERPGAGLVSVRIVNADGSFQPACRRGFPTPLTALYRMLGLSWLFPKSRRFGRYNLTYLDERATSEVDAVCGAYMMGVGNILRKTGGFDPDFFMYGEDIDLCYRVQQAGHKVYYYPGCDIIHFKGKSANKNRLMSALNFYNSMFIFSKKHFSSRMSFFPRSVLFGGIFLNAALKIAADWVFKGAAPLADAGLVNAALFSGLLLKFGSAPNFYQFTGTAWSLLLHFNITASFLAVFMLSGLYSGKPKRLPDFFKACAVSSFLFFSFAYFIPNIRFSRIAFSAACATLAVLLPGWRLLFPQVSSVLGSAVARRRRYLIAGTGALAARLHDRLRLRRGPEGHFEGFVETAASDRRVPPEQVLGGLDRLEVLVKAHRVNEIYLASTAKESFDFMGLIRYCAKSGVSLKIVQEAPSGGSDQLLDITLSENLAL